MSKMNDILKQKNYRKQLKTGIKVEMEHKKTIAKIRKNRKISTKKAAELIAKDHLEEDPNYYTKLTAIELQKLCPVGTKLQTLIFDKTKFTLDKAKKWVRSHDFRGTKVDEKENTYRFRQANPLRFKKDSFRTIEVTEGVKGVIACPIERSEIRAEYQEAEKLTPAEKKMIRDAAFTNPNDLDKAMMYVEPKIIKSKYSSARAYMETLFQAVERPNCTCAFQTLFYQKVK